jgi:phasin family protein
MSFAAITPEQFAAAQKANIEAFFGLSAKAFEGVEKLVALNLQVARASLAEVAESTQAALSIKDPQAFMALQAGLLQPGAEKAVAYGRHVADIFAGTQAELSRVAEATVAEGQKKVLSLVDSAAKNAPAGSENVVAFVKTAITTANNAYESVSKAAKQAADVAEANFQSMTSTAVKATQQATGKARRAA